MSANRGDAEAIAALWSPQGEYVNELDEVFHGREAIQNHFASCFAKNAGLKIKMTISSTHGAI